MSNRNFWDRVQDLQESINGGVEPMDTVTLKTSVVKFALGMYLIQSVFIALILSIVYASFSSWLIPMSALLQVGWLWNRVTESWKYARGFTYSRVSTEQGGVPEDSVCPPTINISTPRATETVPHPLQTDSDIIGQAAGSGEGDLWKTADQV